LDVSPESKEKSFRQVLKSDWPTHPKNTHEVQTKNGHPTQTSLY